MADTLGALKNLFSDFLLPYRVRFSFLLEASSLLFTKIKDYYDFILVSSERNAGSTCIQCLDSVYRQKYPADHIRHIFIDDDSDDETPGLIERWLERHPGHRVEFIRNMARKGGCLNNLTGFRMASPGSIICELNGDDWLPDPGVVSYLNKVYQDPGVWMTYNTLRTSRGRYVMPFPIPELVVRANTFRTNMAYGRALHSFRQELLAHVHEESLIDPDTGDFFASGDDLAFYLCLQELSGIHARHIYRTTYIYNFNGYAEDYGDTEEQKQRKQRILVLPPHQPLTRLDPPNTKSRP